MKVSIHQGNEKPEKLHDFLSLKRYFRAVELCLLSFTGRM
jgi:hypothetical protein